LKYKGKEGKEMEKEGKRGDFQKKSRRAVLITPEIVQRLISARKEMHLTQLELSNQAKVSLRTIRDLERGRRRSFSESTIILVCRALELDVDAVLEGKEYVWLPRTINKTRQLVTMLVVIGIVIAGGLLFGLLYKPQAERVDWVFDNQLPINMFPPDWGDSEGSVINYYKLDQVVAPNQTVPVEIKWSYHFREGSTPVYFVSAFTEWDPDTEIRLFEGTLSGDGSQISNFDVVSPKKLGLHQMRVFFASSFAPMSSFYGHPPDNQLTSPMTAPYLEIPIEVVSKKGDIGKKVDKTL
jgi:transcriptional regulator with XRE-family HTH domain